MDNRHLDLLYDLSELSAVLSGDSALDSFLSQAVELASRYLHADVCSVYIIENGEAVLRSTHGLNPDAIGKIRLKPGEGLVGLAAQTLAPVCVANASAHPQYKHFPEAGEDPFEAFLAVPIQRGEIPVGIIVVQRVKDNLFHASDIMALRAMANHLAAAIDTTQRASAQAEVEEPAFSGIIRGKSASEGISHADSIQFIAAGGTLEEGRVFSGTWTLYDFETAVENTRTQIAELQEKLDQTLPETAALIFTAHQMILKDPNFIDGVKKLIGEGMAPPSAVLKIARHYINLFRNNENAYIQEKANDVEDLARRILGNLLHGGQSDTPPCRDRIVIAKELFPSDMLMLSAEGVKGIILASGGTTSHVAILAHSLDVPMVIADDPRLLSIADGTPILLDAEVGLIYVQPDQHVLQTFHERETTRRTLEEEEAQVKPETKTSDGERVTLLANINLLSELSLACRLKAEGIGLYRSEFPFLIRPTLPTEDEQVRIYGELFKAMDGKEVTIRTLDIGGDKFPAYYDIKKETNPSLGLRSIRFSLLHLEGFKTQLRAIFRAAGENGILRIMFPMISSVDEVLQLRELIKECQEDLESDKLVFPHQYKLGVMMELPAAMEIMEDLARLVDFFCIGTNDFVQYMLAVDRTNELVSNYYQSHHPAVLRGLARMAMIANQYNKPISICGEIAHQAHMLPFLLGIGIRRLSLDPRFLPRIQKRIAQLDMKESQAFASALLSAPTLAETQKLLNAHI